MDYNLKVDGVEAGNGVRDYIERKLESIDKLLQKREQNVRVDIELAYLESEEKTYTADCSLHDGAAIFADARASTLHEAIDRMIDVLSYELTKEHKKRINHVRKGAAKAKEMLREGGEV